MDGKQAAALLRIRSYRWEPQEVEYAFQILSEQIAEIGEDELETASHYSVSWDCC